MARRRKKKFSKKVIRKTATYKSSQKNFKLREKERKQGRKRHSLGSYNPGEGMRRHTQGSKKGSFVAPEGGFLRNPKKAWADLDKDQITTARNNLINEMNAKGFDNDRQLAELTNFEDGYQRAKGLAQAIKDKKSRDNENAFKNNEFGRTLWNTLKHGPTDTIQNRDKLSSYKESEKLIKDRKTDWGLLAPVGKKVKQGYQDVTPDSIERNVSRIAKKHKKLGTTGLKDLVEEISRPGLGASNAYYEQIREEQAKGKSGRGFLTYLKSLNNGRDFARGWDFQDQMEEGWKPKTGYNISKLLDPKGSNAGHAWAGLAFDLVADPLNLVGAAPFRAASKVATGEKALRQVAEKALRSDVAAVDHLLSTKGKPLKERRKAAKRYMQTVEKPTGKGKEFRFSVRAPDAQGVERRILFPGSKAKETGRFRTSMKPFTIAVHKSKAKETRDTLKGKPTDKYLDTNGVPPWLPQHLQDAGYKVPDDPALLPAWLRDNEVPVFDSHSKHYQPGDPAIQGGIDLAELTPEHLAFHDLMRYQNKGYGLKEARVDRDVALRDYQYDLPVGAVDEFVAEAGKRHVLTKAADKEGRTQSALDSVVKASQEPDRVGIALRFVGQDVIRIPMPTQTLAKLSESFPKPYKFLSDITMLGTYHRKFENFETKMRDTRKQGLVDIRSETLVGSSRIFQYFAKKFGKTFDDLPHPKERKAVLESLTAKMNAPGFHPDQLTGTEREIYDEFDDLITFFDGSWRNAYTDTPMPIGMVSRFLPEEFSIAGELLARGKITTPKELIEAIGTGLDAKITKALEEVGNIKKAWKKAHKTTPPTKAELKTHKTQLKQAQDELDRLIDLADKNRAADPMQALWATRLAVTEATGVKSLVDSLGIGFGVKAFKRVYSKNKVNDSNVSHNALTGDAGLEAAIKEAEAAGFKQIDGIDELSEYIFPAEMHEPIKLLWKLVNDRDTAEGLFKMIDKATGAWKAGATIYNPGYYTRNMIGEVVAGWFGGVNNPKYYTDAINIVTRITRKMEEDLAPYLTSHTPWATYRESGNKLPGKRTHTIAGEKFNDAEVVLLFHDRGLITNFVNTEFHEVLGVHGVSKLKKPFVGTHNFLRSMGEVGENIPRMAHFLHGLEHAPKGSVDEAASYAAKEVRHFHFDYSDTTEFEQKVMQRLFPFYKWTRKAAPMVLEALFASPAKLLAYPKAMSGLANATGNNDEMNGWVPDYGKDIPDFIKLMLAYPIGSDASGDPTYYNINTTGMDALKALANPQAAAELMLNPGIKTPFEQAWGEKLNEQFDKDGMQGRERVSEFLGQLPATKYADDLHKNRAGQKTEFGNDKDSKLTEPGALMDERTHNFITGLTAIEVKDRKPYDPNQFNQNRLDKGKFGFDMYLSSVTKDAAAGRRAGLYMRNNPDQFPQYKEIDKWVDANGNIDWSLRQYYNKWVSAYGKYTNKDGSVDWSRINKDRAAGTLEQADPDTLAADKAKKEADRLKFLKSIGQG